MKPLDSPADLSGRAARGTLVSTLAMIGSAACWGFATVMSRDLLDVMASTPLLVVQLSASVVVLCALALAERASAIGVRGLGRASLTGILEPGLAYAVGLLGLAYTSASNASVIGSTEPIIIVVLAWLFLGQRPTPRLALCIAVAVAGVIAISWSGAEETGGASFFGDMLIIVATAFAAGYVVISSRLIRDFPAATLAAGQQSVGLALAIVIYIVARMFDVQTQDWSAVSPEILTYAAFSGVVQYAAAFWLYLIGLRYLSAGAAALWLTLIPVFGVAGAMVWLGERPGMAVFIGGATIIAAIIFANLERQAPASVDRV